MVTVRTEMKTIYLIKKLTLSAWAYPSRTTDVQATRSSFCAEKWVSFFAKNNAIQHTLELSTI